MDSAIAPTYNLRPEQKLQNHTEYPRKVKKLKLLEFTAGCKMSGQFAKVGLNGGVTRTLHRAVNVVPRN